MGASYWIYGSIANVALVVALCNLSIWTGEYDCEADVPRSARMYDTLYVS